MKKLKVKRKGRQNSGTQLYDCRFWRNVEVSIAFLKRVVRLGTELYMYCVVHAWGKLDGLITEKPEE
jgi:hypothetical protein